MQDFLILIEIYWPTLVALTLASFLLSQIGAHIACRNQSLQVFCLSQASISGVLLALLLSLSLSGSEELHTFVENAHWLPSVSSVAVASLVGWFLSKLTEDKPASISPFYIAAFALITAFNAMISRVFPSLESHFTQAFFGDLIALSSELILAISLSSLAIGYIYLKNWRRFASESFEIAYFGFSQTRTLTSRLLPLFAITFICISVQSMGLMASLAFLFLPTVILNFFNLRKVHEHLLFAGLLSTSASFIGFILSLALPELPTTPTITLSIGFIGLLSLFIKRQKKLFS